MYLLPGCLDLVKGFSMKMDSSPSVVFCEGPGFNVGEVTSVLFCSLNEHICDSCLPNVPTVFSDGFILLAV